MESRGLLELPSTSRLTQRPAISPVVQEQLSHLRNEINLVEQCLQTAEPDDLPPLRTVLLQVSKMISTLERKVEHMNVERLNLKNEVRTFQDENIHLQGALIRERRKGQRKDRGLNPSRGITPPPPPPPPSRANSMLYHSMRSFIFPPAMTRCRPLNENDSSVMDLTFDGTGSSTSAVRTSINVLSGDWGGRRGSGPVRGRGSSLASARRAGAKRGRVARISGAPRPSVRIMSGNDVTQSVPGTSSGRSEGRVSGPPTDNTANENSLLSNRLICRNNRLASNKRPYNFLSSFPSFPPLD